MGHRLSKIYTKTGDDGTTGLGDGKRVAKDSHRVEAYGSVDELNSAIGLILSDKDVSSTIHVCLTRVQNELFDLGSELCLPGYYAIHEKHIEKLESDLDNFNNELKPLKEFILPGGHPASCHSHIARTICRRAERRVVTLSMHEEVAHYVLHYLNRLSDLLFVVARKINFENKIDEPLWQHERK